MSSSILPLDVADVAPKGANASQSEVPVGPGELAVLALIATVALPIWIVPAAVYGITIGVKQKLHALSAVSAGSKSKGSHAEEIRPHFEAAEKNPTPHAFFRLGIHLLLAADLHGARRFLRRAIALAKTQNPSGWDRTDIQLLPLLALANQQMGDIQMRLHVFNEAYEHYVECKRLLDNLAKLGEEQKPKKSANENDNNDAGEEESINLLDRDTVDHNIGWSLLHKALYSTTPNNREELEANASVIRSAAELLRKPHSVSTTGEVHAAIGQFFAFVYPFDHNRPDPIKKGDADKNERDSYDFTDAYYTEFIPKFKSEFWEKIAPLFIDLCKKYENSTPGSADHSIWLEASTYLGRCYFIKGGEENIQLGAEAIKRVSDYVKKHPECDQSLKEEFKQVDFFAHQDPRGEDRETEYYRIWYFTMPLALSEPQTQHAGAVPHEWVKHTCLRPTFCDKCQKFITLLENHHGCFMCKACHFRCHVACKVELGNDAICAVASDKSQMQDHQHVMRKTVLGKPTWCRKCNVLIKNPFGAFACEACSIVVHEDCMKIMKNVLVAEKK